MATKVKAKNIVQLIKEGLSLGKKEVIVTFFPAYDPKYHSMLPDNLIETLKRQKVSTFSIVTEAIEIVAIIRMNSKDVKSIVWA